MELLWRLVLMARRKSVVITFSERWIFVGKVLGARSTRVCKAGWSMQTVRTWDIQLWIHTVNSCVKVPWERKSLPMPWDIWKSAILLFLRYSLIAIFSRCLFVVNSLSVNAFLPRCMRTREIKTVTKSGLVYQRDSPELRCKVHWRAE